MWDGIDGRTDINEKAKKELKIEENNEAKEEEGRRRLEGE
jgi:hypothetical protein